MYRLLLLLLFLSCICGSLDVLIVAVCQTVGLRGATLADPLNVLCVSVRGCCACECVYVSLIIPPSYIFFLVPVSQNLPSKSQIDAMSDQ